MGKAATKLPGNDAQELTARLKLLNTIRIENERAMLRLARAPRGTPAYKAAMAEIEQNTMTELELRMSNIDELVEPLAD